MASTGLKGAYPLTEKGISDAVRSRSPGAYALGKVENDTFRISRVGRSDGDVAARLRQYVGKYARFKFGYFPSAKAAFEKECHLYHDFGPPDNRVHPDRPDGTNWTCPRCHLFD